MREGELLQYLLSGAHPRSETHWCNTNTSRDSYRSKLSWQNKGLVNVLRYPKSHQRSEAEPGRELFND